MPQACIFCTCQCNSNGLSPLIVPAPMMNRIFNFRESIRQRFFSIGLQRLNGVRRPGLEVALASAAVVSATMLFLLLREPLFHLIAHLAAGVSPENRPYLFPIIGFFNVVLATPAFLSLAALVSAVVMAVRWRRDKQRLCLNCGYDRTGSTSSVCAECGKTSDDSS